jgi:hypothetical protein
VFRLDVLQPLSKTLDWLERPANGKHSSLLQIFLNYGREKLSNMGPRPDRLINLDVCYKTFIFARNKEPHL